MKLQHVPTIDLGPYFEGSTDGKQQVAEAVDRACQDIGFLVTTNHGIPTELVDRVYNLSRQFFDQLLAEKRKADRPRPDMGRGYSAVAEGTNIEEDQMGGRCPQRLWQPYHRQAG